VNNKVEINSDKKIQEIKDNLIGIHDIILKKIISSKNLKFKKINNSSQNLNKNFNSIMNSPLNLFIRFFRFLKKYFFLILLIIFISSLIMTVLIFYYQFQIFMFLIKYNIDTSYLISFINVIDKLFLLFNEYYQSIIIYFSEINIKNN
jgi:hypothetical protein